MKINVGKLKELEEFSYFIKSKYGFEFNIHKNNRMYLEKKYVKSFKEIVMPFIHKTMMSVWFRLT